MNAQNLRQRRPQASRREDSSDDAKTPSSLMSDQKPRSQWLVFAIASGGCAALNGVFAKLTTTAMTSSWASTIASGFGLSPDNSFIDVLVRASMFGLNLLFNLIMWTLFTRALTLATSTTRVSILNTSANFLLTAVLSLLIFSETLPPLWFVGAALLVGGSVIIGAREEQGKGGENLERDVSDGESVGGEGTAEIGLDGLEGGEQETGVVGGGEGKYTDEPRLGEGRS